MEINAPATVKKKMAALRRVLSEARKLKLMDAQSYEAAIDLPQIKSSAKVRGRALTQTEITALIEACHRDSSVLEARDAALIGILRGGGLRRAEVVKLRLKDFKPETGELQVIDGKGAKDRTVYLPKAGVCFVKDWLEVRGYRAGALLCPVRKGGQIEFRQMSSQAVLLILQKRAADAGVDIVTVQKLAGHSSPMTTARYDRPSH
ncbi:MAG: site-specific integrase [Spirulinaceae cyanobacterium]